MKKKKENKLEEAKIVIYTLFLLWYWHTIDYFAPESLTQPHPHPKFLSSMPTANPVFQRLILSSFLQIPLSLLSIRIWETCFPKSNGYPKTQSEIE